MLIDLDLPGPGSMDLNSKPWNSSGSTKPKSTSWLETPPSSQEPQWLPAHHSTIPSVGPLICWSKTTTPGQSQCPLLKKLPEPPLHWWATSVSQGCDTEPWSAALWLESKVSNQYSGFSLRKKGRTGPGGNDLGPKNQQLVNTHKTHPVYAVWP